MSPHPEQPLPISARSRPSSGGWVGLCAALVLPAAASAQQVLAPPPAEFAARPPADPLAAPGEEEPGAITSALGTGEGALQWMVSHLHPRILYRFLYGDGIQSLPGVQEQTAIHEIYPGISLNIGKHVSLGYAPTIRIYSSDSFEDTFDQSLSFRWHTVYRDWAFALNHNYSYSSQPLIETGAQTDTETFGTFLSGSWAMNRSLSLELGLVHSLRLLSGRAGGQQLSDVQSFSTMDWLNYNFARGLSAAIGVGAGYDDVSSGPNMVSEQVRGRINWRVQQRLDLSVSGGVEARQFLEGDASANVTPVFRGTATYQLFNPTRVFVSGSRLVSPSYFANELSESTQVSAGVQQRLVGKLMFNLTAGYRFTTYSTTVADLDVTREDESTFVNARLSTVLFKRASVALLYQRSENTSDASQFRYDSNQVGFEIGYHF